MKRLFEQKEFALIKKNYLHDMRIWNICFVVGVIRKKLFILRSKKYTP